ncbi:MAG: beta-xylosidase family glycoside hydrolase, partial [Flavisolibacter sp.]
NVLQQKSTADKFMITTKMEFKSNAALENEKAGLAVMGLSYAGIALKSSKQGLKLVYIETTDAAKGNKENETIVSAISQNNIYLRLRVTEGYVCSFSYSLDGKTFKDAGKVFTASAGRWKGAKPGIFCTGESDTNDAGFADFDWFRVENND